VAGTKSGATGKTPTPPSTAPNGRKRPFGATKSAASKPEVRIFVSYSHLDDASREKLAKHLAPLAREDVNFWFDGDIRAGEELDPEISRALRRAHLFVALISSNYLSSNYCWKKEYLPAMGRRTRGTMHVVGVVLKPCDWKNTKAARFKQLPRDGRAVTDWRSADHAYLDVTEGIRKVVKDIRRDVGTIPSEEGRGAKRPEGDPEGRPRTQSAEGFPEEAGGSAEAGARPGRELRSRKVGPGDEAGPPAPACVILDG